MATFLKTILLGSNITLAEQPSKSQTQQRAVELSGTRPQGANRLAVNSSSTVNKKNWIKKAKHETKAQKTQAGKLRDKSAQTEKKQMEEDNMLAVGGEIEDFSTMQDYVGRIHDSKKSSYHSGLMHISRAKHLDNTNTDRRMVSTIFTSSCFIPRLFTVAVHGV